MSNTLLTVNREKVLPDERYDEKLFKQAYKAGLEAKELEKKNSKKKKLFKISVILFSFLLVLGIVSSFFLFKKEKLEYIEAQEENKQVSFYEIQDDIEILPLTLNISANNISAQSALVFDSRNGSFIFEKNIDERRPIASITKLLSVIVALETFKLDDTVEVSLENIPENLDWKLELQEGDIIKVDALLKSMLLSSFNDTAYILANAYPNGGYSGFVKAMNNKAKVLRMEDSMFSNPAGLDNEKNYSTARDVGKLVAATLNYEYILDITSKASANISWNSGDELKSKIIYTTNQLYGVNPYSKGLKTGITKDAKQCFVGYFVYPSKGEIITVVLGSEDRFTDTQNLERLSRQVLERK
ncbi:hypothetical protein CVU76_01610 [Candidatus Dojkabacteria bacterium HGW-Dojkabacteria-1]|uniref:Peptidase S11 D-alanyl-D-alanine carboxypeptidase A N-terminal domain-containing protein n=1 Tax=Candidatus Dojkabacteria bacterium HGW-Dojkabacteria-1 TaxID=2013761 RepID=A0A2N2F3I6_9BACT|nr:MAG: hypothetical protein CVU76_01610 [Candidatus Dojkabacteria bacterium HGW-Dojkabacteria-1]